MRSKTRRFTLFCNSRQLSQFATFFIETGTKISIVESEKKLLNFTLIKIYIIKSILKKLIKKNKKRFFNSFFIFLNSLYFVSIKKKLFFDLLILTTNEKAERLVREKN